ncbi:hypothetical protein EES39_12590 [Streptomyces sp. ADI92-24]|nr:hypothetical protein EES39_12590 [Streptomyces sp. ADI92-24]
MFQPVPIFVYGVVGFSAAPHAGLYVRSSPVFIRTSTSLQRSPLTSSNGTVAVTVFAPVQPEPENFVSTRPVPVPVPARQSATPAGVNASRSPKPSLPTKSRATAAPPDSFTVPEVVRAVPWPSAGFAVRVQVYAPLATSRPAASFPFHPAFTSPRASPPVSVRTAAPVALFFSVNCQDAAGFDSHQRGDQDALAAWTDAAASVSRTESAEVFTPEGTTWTFPPLSAYTSGPPNRSRVQPSPGSALAGLPTVRVPAVPRTSVTRRTPSFSQPTYPSPSMADRWAGSRTDFFVTVPYTPDVASPHSQ